MKHLPMLSAISLAAIFLVVGCGGGDTSQGSSSQGEQEDHPRHGGSENLVFRPEGDSGVSGSASFEDRSDGIVVKLDLRGLPKSNTYYLAHIHPGTCAKEAEDGHAHEEEHGEHPGEGEGQEREEEYDFGHGEDGEVSYALTQVKSNSEGRGSSTTMFGQLSVAKLFSGEPKHVMVHEAGSGNPPVLTCADLERAG